MHIGTMLDIYHALCAHVHMGAMTLSLYLHVITFTNECWPDFYNENNIMRVPLSRSAGDSIQGRQELWHATRAQTIPMSFIIMYMYIASSYISQGMIAV